MALVNDPVVPAVISLDLVDIGGNKVTKEFKVRTDKWDPATGLIADLKTIRDNLVTALNAATYALILRSRIVLNQIDDTSLIGAGQVENIASVSCNLTTVGQRRTIKVPAAHDALFLDTSGEDHNRVDKASAELLALLEFYTDTDGSFYIGTGLHLADADFVASGKRIHRGSVSG